MKDLQTTQTTQINTANQPGQINEHGNRITYKEERIWGSFDQFSLNEQTTVKLLYVKKGCHTSLQEHEGREEFWRVISGTPTLIVGDTEKPVIAKEKDEFTIPAKHKHQISAPDGDVCILEISRGNFNENDITRYTNN